MSETLAELQHVIQDSQLFEDYFKKLLIASVGDEDVNEEDAGQPVFTIGWSASGYYWEITQIRLEDNDKLTVEIDIGPYWGGIYPANVTDYGVTFEQLRMYLLNRKWGDPNVDTLRLVADEIDKVEGTKYSYSEEKPFDYDEPYEDDN